MPLQVAAAGVRRKSLKELLDDACAEIEAGLGDARPGLGFVFFTNHFEDDGVVISRELRKRLGLSVIIGGSAEGVVGPRHEYENEPALAVWAAALPAGALARPFHFGKDELDAAARSADWHALLGEVEAADRPAFVAVADPYSADVSAVLDGLNQHFAGAPLLGGMASGAEAPGQAALICNDEVRRDGVVGVALAGSVAVEALVSQGCRPVGRPLIVTKADRHIIFTLGGKRALDTLVEVFEDASEAEQRLMQRGIFLGRAIKEEKAEFKRGDFLIRNLMDKDDRSGAIAVNDFIRPGVTVQFHVRDAATADEDLKDLAARQPAPAGALLFCCNGRGVGLFQARDHDVAALNSAWGQTPIAGFFCAGELGPVGGRNFIHGYTASVALFREATKN
jgi:small ligand-binding sensory domain FIST